MTIKPVIFFLLMLWSFVLRGQTLRSPIAAPYLGTGAYSVNHVDVFSFTSNQAALAQVNHAAVGIYGERRFLLSELSNYRASVAITSPSGNFGLQGGYFGFADYNESQLALAYARKLGTKMDVGVQFNYNGIKAAGYGKASAISFDAGTIFHVTDKLHTGFHVNNPVGGTFGKNADEKLPSIYTVGFGYDASKQFFFTAEIIKQEDQEVNVNAALQYKFVPQLLARLGISSATSSVWFGLGLLFHSFRLDIAASYHPQLGITPGLLIAFDFKSKSEER
jgi:hypothetical protein